ncbi:MAG: hypothetical protein J6I98_00465, partial [Clostridia bacterium]|nr:hypothetical protein [Clostridia bacterium]
RVYCVVTDQYGNSETSNTVTLSIQEPPVITTQPKLTFTKQGAIAKTTVKATGDGLTYQWYFKNAGASSFSKTTSFTGTSYSAVMNAARDGRQIYCVVTDKYGKTAKSNTVTLSME